jgi:hypothetical protein
MRGIVLLSLLLLSACTIREETFSPRDEADGRLSLTAPEPNAPTAGDDNDACRGGLARCSRIDEYRDGSVNLYCD